MKPIFSCSIPGRIYVKKNTARRFGSGKGTRLIYSDNFLAWEKTAKRTLHLTNKSTVIECLLFAVYRFYFKDHQAEADVSNLVEGVADALTDSNVIGDDKQIYKFTSEKFFVHDPRVEIDLFEYKETAA